MSINNENLSNLKSIDNVLCEAEEKLKEAISLSLNDISNNPNIEKELFSLWKKHANNLRDYFIHQAEKSGNSALGKKLFKSFIFKRF